MLYALIRQKVEAMTERSSLQRQTTVETESAITLFKRDFSKLGSFVDKMKETLCSSEVQFRAMERHIEQLVNETSHLKNELMKKEAQIQILMEANGRLSEERDCWMQIFVKSSISGKTITLYVKRTNTIDNINAMIQDKEGISRNQRATSFCMTFDGKRLEGERTVAYYNIEKESTLHYVARFTHEPKIQFYIETPTGRTIDIHTAVSDTIENLKLMVQGKIGMLVEDQRFIFRGRQLADGRKLLDYNIHEGSVVRLLERMPSRGFTVKVYVRNLSKKRFTLNVGFFDTIRSVKARIRDREGLPPDGDRLFGLDFQGNSLDEDRLVGHYNITNSTICMVQK